MELEEERVKKLTKPRDKAASMDTKRLTQKIHNSEELRLLMESSLSDQMAEKATMQSLTYENERLKIHHDDMQVNYDRMQQRYDLLMDDLNYLKEKDEKQKQEIERLHKEIQELHGTHGGDRVMKDMQDRLIRLANDQSEKDMRIHKLEMLLDIPVEQRKRNTRQSEVCVVL